MSDEHTAEEGSAQMPDTGSQPAGSAETTAPAPAAAPSPAPAPAPAPAQAAAAPAQPERKAARIGPLVITVLLIIVAIAAAYGLWTVFLHKTTQVPQLQGMQEADALTAISYASLDAGDRTDVATTSVSAGVVVGQHPEANASVRMHTRVDISVSVAPMPVDVPSLVKKDVSAATKTLTDAMLVPVTIDCFDPTATVGVVTQQAPPAGAQWRTGQPVAMCVVVGKDDGTGVKVPDLTGKNSEEAKLAVQNTGLHYTVIAGNIDAPQTFVTEQLPSGGTVVRPGSTIFVLFQQQ